MQDATDAETKVTEAQQLLVLFEATKASLELEKAEDEQMAADLTEVRNLQKKIMETQASYDAEKTKADTAV